MHSELETGIITTVLHERGYGFIRSDETQQDHFFHRRDVRDVFTDLQPYTVVVFKSVVNTKRWKQNGRRAENVCIAK
jgi:cold shock CspA family protein